MEFNKETIGIIIFFALIIGVNFIMYAVVRGAARSNQKSFLETINKSLNTSMQKKDNSMSELRKKMEELEKDKKE